MSLSKRLEDELSREEEREPRYGEEVENWPSEAEMRADADLDE